MNDVISLIDIRAEDRRIFIDVHRRGAGQRMILFVIIVDFFMRDINAVQILLSV